MPKRVVTTDIMSGSSSSSVDRESELVEILKKIEARKKQIETAQAEYCKHLQLYAVLEAEYHKITGKSLENTGVSPPI